MDSFTPIDRAVRICPDYSLTVIPPNIAPLNFVVRETGSHYFVKIYSDQGRPIEISSAKPQIIIPGKPWHELLENNPGAELFFDIYVKAENGNWNRFKTITNMIASEEIDSFIAYRKIHPGHGKWGQIGIYQRNLENYDETIILHNRSFPQECVNCHAFRNNRTDKMLIGIRSSSYGSSAVLVEDGLAKKIGTKFGYTSWHPSGKLAVFSVNKVRQYFHSMKEEIRDVADLDSLLAYYLLDSKKVITTPAISMKDRLETYPAWSPDGRNLYFSSAEMFWKNKQKVTPQDYENLKYDLVRIGYDVERDEWGKPETVISAKDAGKSILEPRISPDGRWLLVCMCDYGCFPVYQPSSDLYLIDLKAAKESGEYKYRRLDINSDLSESWHSFSSNSRWIAFSSKRDYGVFTRSYFSYIDKSGKVHKPILMPQKDPEFYDSYLYTFSVPELIAEPVKVTGEKLGKVVRSSVAIPIEMPITMATPKADGTTEYEPWQERE
jgi:hypothetical protein